MVFEPGDAGPWWLSDELRESQKYDVTNEQQLSKVVARTQAELVKALSEEAGIFVEPNRTLPELKEFANRHNICLTWDKANVTEGWHLKAKGLLQVLWERRFIDVRKCKEQQETIGNKFFNTSCYSLFGKNDSITGQYDESTSLQSLMSQFLLDFQTEETALQHLGSELGLLKVMFTPKFHCEFAVEGVEDNWAQAKALMRRQPILMRKGRANFVDLVMKCICFATNLTKERVRKFSA